MKKYFPWFFLTIGIFLATISWNYISFPYDLTNTIVGEYSLKKMLQWELNKLQERIHILEAYVIVFKYLDKVIKLIRTVDDPKKKNYVIM